MPNYSRTFSVPNADMDGQALEPNAIFEPALVDAVKRPIERTPYNIISVALKYMEEASDLIGEPQAWRDLINRGYGVPSESIATATAESMAMDTSFESRYKVMERVAADIRWVLEHTENRDELAELFTEMRLPHAEGTAQLLMENIQHPLHDIGLPFEEEEKLFWAKVAIHMGPDYVERFRKIGTFMKRWDEFR